MHQKISANLLSDSASYNAVPTAVLGLAAPRPQEGFLNCWDRRRGLLGSGARTLDTSLTEADQRAEKLVKWCQRRVRDGQPEAVVELLDINPVFIMHPWVAEKFFRFEKSGRLRRRRGRPKGRYKLHPLWVLGLVEHLISTGEAKTREKALGLLDQFGIIPRSTAERLCREALNDSRFRPIALTFPELARKPTQDEVAELRDA